MKLSLVVADGVHKGKVIPIALSQFLIGRDPQCHLRPASSMISKRHCAILVHGGKVHVKDFNSTNGTFLNDEPVKEEVELHNGDQLKVGPLLFSVAMETSVPVDQATPVPPTTLPKPAAKKTASAGDDDESIAAMLLEMQDEGGKGVPTGEVGPDGVPTGSTVMEPFAAAGASAEDTAQSGVPSAAAKRGEAAKQASGNTSAAAKAILEKYTRRPRT
jgi:pSer/pThr/pTyr-binding forkhead associated (FHA) protein